MTAIRRLILLWGQSSFAVPSVYTMPYQLKDPTLLYIGDLTLTKSNKKLRGTVKPTKGFSESEGKQIESLWARMPNDCRDVLHLYHHGRYEPYMSKLVVVEAIEKGIRAKLTGVKPTPQLKKWAIGMLSYWNTVLFGLDLFKSKDAYARANL